MAIRNYVGARYVPKFADPIGWQANTSYEAMVIVTYNNSSYTSKIPVPPTVGNPAENSKYWVLTGNYNAQIEEYRRATAEAQEHARDGICAVDEGNNTTAGENHKIGEYFWLNNKLYRATKYISAGDLFSTSNTQETNISEGVYTNYSDITSLKNDVSNNKTNIQNLSDNVTGNTNNIYDHVNNRLNPHNVTKAQVGLGNVDNVSKSDILKAVYPVGSIYMSTTSTSPAELFAGTWERIKDRFLLAVGDTYTAGSTGGEAEHVLTNDEMPNHRHDFDRQQWRTADEVSSTQTDAIFSWRTLDQVGGNATYSYKGFVSSSGGSQPHNNMPPYLAVYIWKRIA